MQQFIYHSGNQKSRANIISADYPDHHLTHLVAEDSSLKINDIRDLTASLAITHQGNRLIWIEEAHSLTLPAQHALLKTLEEPPKNTIIILSTHTPSTLLPTIISRCALVSVTRETTIELDPHELALIKTALSSTPGVRLQLANILGKKRGEIHDYLTKIIKILHQVMQTTDSSNSLSLLTKISHDAHLALSRVKTNTNVTLSIESFFLSLPRSHWYGILPSVTNNQELIANN